MKAVPPVDLEIGIRSDNIIPGMELSKVMLPAYDVHADSTWQEVVILLSDFADLDSQLDFSIKCAHAEILQNGASYICFRQTCSRKWLSMERLRK